MTNMIERVARAIALGVEDDPDNWRLYAMPACEAIRVAIEECAWVAEKQQIGELSMRSGYAVVPVEPTEKMLLVLCDQWDSVGSRTMRENYAAMLAAAQEGSRD